MNLWDRWVFALRSGYYKKIENKWIDNNGGSCAVGVLFRETGLSNYIDPSGHIPNENVKYFNKVLEGSGFVEKFMAKKDNSYFIYSHFIQEIIRMNDDGHSFSEIADFIEVHKQQTKGGHNVQKIEKKYSIKSDAKGKVGETQAA